MSNPENLSETWVADSKPGTYLWLTKESALAVIAKKFQPDVLSPGIGQITIQLARNGDWNLERWFVRANGQGIDHSQLFWPVTLEPEHEITTFQVHTELTRLKDRISNLENAMKIILQSDDEEVSLEIQN